MFDTQRFHPLYWLRQAGVLFLFVSILAGSSFSFTNIVAKLECVAIGYENLTRAYAVNEQKLIQIISRSDYDDQRSPIGNLFLKFRRECPSGSSCKGVWRSRDERQVCMKYLVPCFFGRESIPVQSFAASGREYAISRDNVRDGRTTYVQQNSPDFNWFANGERSHLTRKYSEIRSLTEVQLQTGDTSINPRANNGPSCEAVVTLSLAILCFLISAVLLEYGLWNVYYGPIDWRGDMAVLGGFIPFMLGWLLIFSLAS
jgi:hypothetical protein